MVENKEVILKVYKTRKAYLFAYILAIILLLFLSYLYIKKYEIHPYLLFAGLAFIIGTFLIIEILHHREWWAITENSLIHSVSILNKNVREVGFSSISDIDLDKPLIKRFLNYGDVNVRLFLNETSIKINNINNPEKFIKLIQGLMLGNRSQKNVITRNG